MLHVHPAARFPGDTFRDYDRAAPAVRVALGLGRLSPALAASVRDAVARHASRAARSPLPGPAIDRLHERLRRETEAAVTPHADHHRSKGESRVCVAVGARPKAWMNAPTRYVSGQGFGRVVTETTQHITVMPSWRRRVLGRGLARLDGMLTTHAEAIPAAGEIEIYRASWVRQRAGYNLAAESGTLAYHRPTGTAFHLAGPVDALRVANGLRRKLKAQGVAPADRDAARARMASLAAGRRAARLGRMAARIARWDLDDVGDVVVTRVDSLGAGNCEPGTDDFIGRYFPGRSEATIGEIARAVGRVDLAALSEADATLARQLAAACLVAVRRQKRAGRLVLA